MLNVERRGRESLQGRAQIAWMEIYTGEKSTLSMAKVPGCRPKPWISFVNTGAAIGGLR